MDPMIPIVIVGAVGGLVRVLTWKIETTQAEEETKPLMPYKVLRNAFLGAFSAVAVIAQTSPNAFPPLTPLVAATAFFTGLGGELILQKGGKAIKKVTTK